MSHRHKRLFTIAVLLFSSFILSPAIVSAFNQKNFEEMQKEGDKEFYKKYISEMFDNFDRATSDEERLKYCKKIYTIAKENKDYKTQIEAIGNMGENDRFNEEKYIAMADKLPKSHAKSELITFLKYLQTSDLTDESYDRNSEASFWNELITEYKNTGRSDIYSQAGTLFNICAFYSKTLSGTVNTKYLDELGKIINKLPQDGRKFLPLAYYRLTAHYYVNQRATQGQRAGVFACRQTLDKIDATERQMRKDGRKYANMDKERYATYRLMLKCDQVLSKDEMTECFYQIKAIAERNEEVGREFNSNYSTAKLVYYMSTKDYASAIPILDSILNSKELQEEVWLQKACLEYRFIAGKALGQSSEMRPYLLRYIKQKEQENSDNLDEKLKEMQMLYDVNLLKHKASKKQISLVTVFTFFVIGLLLCTIALLIRSKRGTKKLKDSENVLKNEKEAISQMNKELETKLLAAESDNNMKTLFIQKMDHEIRMPLRDITNYSNLITNNIGQLSPEERKNYSVKIESSAKELITMVETVLSVTSAESEPAEKI
jgi:hypothetical protein